MINAPLLPASVAANGKVVPATSPLTSAISVKQMTEALAQLSSTDQAKVLVNAILIAGPRKAY